MLPKLHILLNQFVLRTGWDVIESTSCSLGHTWINRTWLTKRAIWSFAVVFGTGNHCLCDIRSHSVGIPVYVEPQTPNHSLNKKKTTEGSGAIYLPSH